MKITGQGNLIRQAKAAFNAGAGAALAVFARKQGKKPAKTPQKPQMAMDPTEVLFPDHEEAPGAPQGPGRLQPFLEKSARSMIKRTEELREQKRTLMVRMSDRASAEITLTTQGLRVVIGLIWIGMAAWLFLSAGQAEGSVTAGGMPVEHAQVLSATFFQVSLAAFVVAFGVTGLVSIIGNSDNRKVRDEAEKLGVAIADTSREFDTALNGFRTAMDRRSDPADAVFDLSLAHLTALEACAYFREIGFLMGEGDESNRLFRGFLRSRGGNPPPIPVFLIGAFLGAFFSAGYVFLNFVPSASFPIDMETASVSSTALSQYPWAVVAILGGGLLYVTMGLLVSLAGGPITASAVSRAQEVALDALRAGFTAQAAPRPIDVVRRIEDAVDVFRARVGNARGSAQRRDHRSHQRGANHLRKSDFDFSEENPDVPEWRHKDSSLTFVDTGFTTAPETWRTDAFAKKIDENGAGKPGSKRGRLSFKKPSRN